MFRSKNLEGEMLPPTRAVLLPHITRANYIAMHDKSYVTRSPDLPAIEQSGLAVGQRSVCTCAEPCCTCPSSCDWADQIWMQKRVAQANAAAAIMVYLVHLSASAMISIAPTWQGIHMTVLMMRMMNKFGLMECVSKTAISLTFLRLWACCGCICLK